MLKIKPEWIKEFVKDFNLDFDPKQKLIHALDFKIGFIVPCGEPNRSSIFFESIGVLAPHPNSLSHKTLTKEGFKLALYLKNNPDVSIEDAITQFLLHDTQLPEPH